MEYNSVAPKSSSKEITGYEGLRPNDEIRDDSYSPLFDSIMNAISANLMAYTDYETVQKAWTQSLFPERTSKEILRLVEQYISDREQK